MKKWISEIYFALPQTCKSKIFNIYIKRVNNERYGGVFKSRLEQFQESQYASLEKIKALKVLQINKLLRRCFKYSEFYRNILSDLNYSSKRDYDEGYLKNIPILTKKDLRKNISTIRYKNPR